MRIFTLIIFVVLLGLSAILLPQEPSQKVYGNIEFGGNMLTDSTFGGTGFNAAPDANWLQFGLNYWISEKISAGPTLTASFNAAHGADSLKYTALGIQFLWRFAPRFQFVLNPQYAVWERGGFRSWINFTLGLRYWIVPDLSYLKAHGIVVDGKNPIIGIGVGFKIK
jgi:hypothetical protein